MFKKFKNIIVTTVASAMLLAPGLVVAGGITGVAGGVAFADNITTNLCDGTKAATGGAGNCKQGSGQLQSSIKKIASTVVNTISIIVGVLAVIFIIYGGFKYITSGGDSGKVSEAKNALIYAIIGLLIVAISQAIVRFVLSVGDNINTGQL